MRYWLFGVQISTLFQIINSEIVRTNRPSLIAVRVCDFGLLMVIDENVMLLLFTQEIFLATSFKDNLSFLSNNEVVEEFFANGLKHP